MSRLPSLSRPAPARTCCRLPHRPRPEQLVFRPAPPHASPPTHRSPRLYDQISTNFRNDGLSGAADTLIRFTRQSEPAGQAAGPALRNRPHRAWRIPGRSSSPRPPVRAEHAARPGGQGQGRSEWPQPRRRGDPPGGGRGSGRLPGLRRAEVIDEIQRVPDLLLAIKEQVDADPRPGRYLLSASVERWPYAACRTRCRAASRRSSSGRSPRERSTAPPTGSWTPSSRGRGTRPWIRHDQAGICRTGRAWRFPRSASPHQPASSRALLRLLPGRSRRPRGQPAIRDRAHRRDAGS